MALKDILVHVDSGKHAASRVEAAVALAQTHDAHLTGIFVMTHPEVPAFIQAQLGPDIIEAQRKSVRDSAKHAEGVFRSITDRAGVNAEWRCVDGDLVETLVLHARYADLIVVGQRDKSDDEVAGSSEMPDRLILTTGRPVLVIPYAGNFTKLGERILVAWDASRLATRAVNDAMPILEKAKRVNVIAVNPKGGSEGHGDVPGADIALHLARHGVKADAQHMVAGDVDPGNMLLSRAADEGVDMIVMGAYGHRRWRELVLGGVTHHMLQHMTVPVFMTH